MCSCGEEVEGARSDGVGICGAGEGHNTFLREMLLATLTEMDGSTGSRSYVGGRDVKGNKGRVLVGPGISEEFIVNICLKQ